MLNLVEQLPKDVYEYDDVLIESMRLHDGNIPLWHYHQDRLLQSLKQLNWDTALIAKVANTIRNTSYALPKGTFKLRLLLTKEDSSYFFSINPTTIPAETNCHSITDIITHPGPMISPGIKSIKQLSQIKNLDPAYGLPLGETILLKNPDNHLLEASMANVFVIKDQEIWTPPSDKLLVKGVMRAYLLSNSPIDNYPIIEKNIPLSLLTTAENVFLTNAVRGIIPVIAIGPKALKGTESKRIQQLIHKQLF